MKKRFLTILTAVLAVVLGLAVLSACGGEDRTDSGEMTISISETVISVGEERSLSVKSSSDVDWTTSDDAVVGFSGAVNKKYVKIVGKGKGQAKVTATNKDGDSISCNVTVDEFTIEVGGTENGAVTILRKADGTYEQKTLTAKVLRSGTATDEKVTWSSSNPEIVSVEGGVLTAHDTGTADITVKRQGGTTEVKIPVEVKWESQPAGWYKILHGGEILSVENAGNWVWTGDTGWGNSTPTVKGEGWNTDGDVDFDIEGNTGYRWYGVQLFFKNTELTAGSYYKLTLKINSSIDSYITINDTKVTLSKGDNDVTIYTREGAGDKASVHINLAWHDALRNDMVVQDYDAGNGKQFQEGLLSLRNLTWTAYDPNSAENALHAPTAFSVDATSKEFTVTDNNPNEKIEGYVIGFFEEGKTEPVYTQPIMKPVDGRDILETMNIKDGKMYLDDSFVAEGSYTLKVRAYSGVAQYGDSGWSTATQNYTKTGAVDYKVLPSYRDVDRGIGRYCAWAEFGENGIDFSKSSFSGDTLTIAVAGAQDWYSNQVYYTGGDLLDDHTYQMSFTFNGKDAAGEPIDLTGKQIYVGDTRIDVANGKTFTAKFTGRSITFSLGKPNEDFSATVEGGGLTAGIYTFSNITIKDMEEVSAEKDGNAMYFGDNLNGVTDKLMYWFATDGNWTNPGDGNWTAKGVTLNDWGYADNTASDTKYSYWFDYKIDPIEGKNCSWISRFWYKNSANVSGEEYKLEITIDSNEAGDAVINGTNVHIEAGEHTYKVYYTEGGESLMITLATGNSMMGADADGIRITFKSIKWTRGGRAQLQAPAEAAISSEGAVTFTDPNNKAGVDHYEIGLFRDGTVLVSTQKIEKSGDTVAAGQHQNGTYTVKIRFCGDADHKDTEWVSCGEYTVTNGFDLDSRHEQDTDHAKDHPGQWYHWIDLGWEGGTVTPNKSDIDMQAKTFTFGYTTDGWSNLGFSVQLYYKNAGNVAGKLYTFTADLKLSVNGTITVNGEKVELKANETKHVSIRYTESDLSISIQMGVYQSAAVLNGEITISNWGWEEVTGNPNGDVYDVVYTTKEEPQIPADSTFYYWSEDFGGGMQMTKVKYDHGTVSFDLAGGGNWYSNQIFYRGINIPQVDKGYTFTMKIHSTVAGNIRVNGKIVTLTVGDNDITVESSNGMLSIQMGEPKKGSDGNYAFDKSDNVSTVANGSFTLSDFLWTAADGTQYNLDGKVNK